tara:strand:- start:744 stop:6833 length:6090 start_codon:yes stop_codon:yes gene_type:complete
MNGTNNPLPEEVKKSIDSGLSKGRSFSQVKKILFLGGYQDNSLLVEAEDYYNSKKKSVDPSPSAVNVEVDSTASTSGTMVTPEQDSGGSVSTADSEQTFLDQFQPLKPYSPIQAMMYEGDSVSVEEIEDVKKATQYDPAEAAKPAAPFVAANPITGGDVYTSQDDPRTPNIDETNTAEGLPSFGVDPDLDATYLDQNIYGNNFGYQLDPSNILKGNMDERFANQINELQIIVFDEVINTLPPAALVSSEGDVIQDPSGFLQAFGDFDTVKGQFIGTPEFSMYDDVLDRRALLNILTPEEAAEFMSTPVKIDEDFLRKIASSRVTSGSGPTYTRTTGMYGGTMSFSGPSSTPNSEFRDLEKQFEESRSKIEEDFHNRLNLAIKDSLPITARRDTSTLKNIEQFLRLEHGLSFDLDGDGKSGNRPWLRSRVLPNGEYLVYGDLADAASNAGTTVMNAILLLVETAIMTDPYTVSMGSTVVGPDGETMMDIGLEVLAEERRLGREEIATRRKRMNEYTKSIFESYASGDWGSALEQSFLMTVEAAPVLAATTTAGFFGGPVAAGLVGASFGVVMEADRISDEIFLDTFIDKETGERLNYGEALEAMGIEFQFGQPSQDNREKLEERFEIEPDIIKKSGYLSALATGEFAIDYTLFRALSGAMNTGPAGKATILSWLRGFASGYGKPLAENGIVTAYASLSQEFLATPEGEFNWDEAAMRALDKVAGGSLTATGFVAAGRTYGRIKGVDANSLKTEKVADSAFLLDGDVLQRELNIIAEQRGKSMRSGPEGETAMSILNNSRKRADFLRQQNKDFLDFVGSRSETDLTELMFSHWQLEGLAGQYRRASVNQKAQIKQVAQRLIDDMNSIKAKHEPDFRNREVVEGESTTTQRSRTEDQENQSILNAESQKPTTYNENTLMGSYLNKYGPEGLGFVKDTDTGGYMYSGLPIAEIGKASRTVMGWWRQYMSPTGGILTTSKYEMPDGTIITLDKATRRSLVDAVELGRGIKAADQDQLISLASDFRNLLVEMRFGVETKTTDYSSMSVLDMYREGGDINALKGKSAEEKANIIAENTRRLDEVSQVLAGKKRASDLTFLNESQQRRLTAYREVLDTKSTYLIELLKLQNQKPGRSQAQKDATNELISTIENNKGSYLNRSYRAFSDNGDLFNQILGLGKYDGVPLTDDVQVRFENAVSEEVANIQNLKGQRLKNAAAKIGITTRGKNVEDIRLEIAEYNVMQAIREMKTASESGGFTGILSAGGKVDMLKSRTLDDRPAFRKLLGEVEDPIVNFVTSVNKINQYVGNARHHQALFDALDKAGIIRVGAKAPPGEGWNKLEPNAPDWSPLKDVWVRESFKQGYDAVQPLEMSPNDIFRFFQKFSGQIKIGKTVYSPTTQFRNFASGMVIASTNGHLPFSTKGNTVSNIMMVLDKTNRPINDASFAAEKRKLIEAGVLQDGANAGELMDTLRDFTGEVDAVMKMTGPNKLARFQEFAQKCYRFGDDYFKVNGYYIEKNRLIDAGYDEATAHTMAARRIKDCYPTYSKIPRAGRLVRRFPFAGDFVSFPIETVRTQVNIVKYGMEDVINGMKTGNANLVAIGMSRLGGLLTAASAPGLISEISKDQYGISDDMDLALRVLSGADWNRNSKFAYVGTDEQGNPEFVDLTFLFPTEYTISAIRAFMEGNPLEDRGLYDNVMNAFNQISMPFGRSMLMQLFTGKEKEQGLIDIINKFMDEDSALTIDERLVNLGKDFYKVISKAFPGAYNNVQEFARANNLLPEFFGEKQTPFKNYDNATATAALFGFRLTGVKLDESAIRGIDGEIRNFNTAKRTVFEDVVRGINEGNLDTKYTDEYLNELVLEYFQKGSVLNNRIAAYLDLIMAFRPEDGREVAATALKQSNVTTGNIEEFIDIYLEGAYSNYALTDLSDDALDQALLDFAKGLEGYVRIDRNVIRDENGKKTGEELVPIFKNSDIQAKYYRYEEEIRRIFDVINDKIYQMNQENPITVQQDRTGVPTEKNPTGVTIFPEDRNIQFERD